ncbi:MAG: hypothetical protein ACKOT0_11455 [bacterium]
MGVVALSMVVATAGQARAADAAIDIGSRLELFVDEHLVDSLTGAVLRLHAPVRQPPARSPLPHGPYGTVIKDGDRYRAYYRADIPGYDVPSERREGDPNEITAYAESRDGVEWTFPELGITDVRSGQGGNVVLARQPHFSHNFSPFLDTRPGVEPDQRYKALAGGPTSGLHAFTSADGLRWTRIQDAPVLVTPPFSAANFGPYAFDSQNPAFWSEAENCYVCFVRTWSTGPGPQGVRRISRATSPDFVTWSPPVDTQANLPGEQLYTSQVRPYFRAPHVYISTPMRFAQGLLHGKAVAGNDGSSDILFMTMRAGAATFQRTFREAFMRPGLDPRRWERKANSLWCSVVPTGPAEMSLYHVNGDRYTLRTDGFTSVRAGADKGTLVTKPLIFAGDALVVNFSTSAAGSLRVELQDAAGQPLPGFMAADCVALVGDAIERRVEWKNAPDLRATAGTPVRIRFELQDCDLYSFRFLPP